MKKIILSAIILCTGLVSCKKENGPSCQVTVSAIAANYKLTKVETVSSSASTDVTATALGDCQKSAFYRLKTDKTYTYTEVSSSCIGSGDGVWNADSNTLSLAGPGGYQFVSAPVDSWNCNTLIVSQNINVAGTSVKYRFTFTKQ